jgi:hypothetical protein
LELHSVKSIVVFLAAKVLFLVDAAVVVQNAAASAASVASVASSPFSLLIMSLLAVLRR